ncbi:DUF1702 family protein [Nocardia amamiensis]|uniref:DUF1702 family protein n=1 Tax=Nocardia amamiensis TaxID=404578 RepID=UPI00082B7C3F|nr:DUF1702 family protein [Nocardia amamiensis]
MPSPIGPLRAALLVPSPASVRMVLSQFEQPDQHTALELEQVTMALVTGIDSAVRSANNDELIATLLQVPPKYRGFAYEGAAVGLTAIDSLSPGRRAAELISGPASEYALTMYVGVGLAMAKIPKFRWNKVFPQHPLFRWLAIDGYGFYNAFFKMQRYVRDKHVETRFPGWLGDRDNLKRIVDQGTGRALWFIGGGSPAGVVRMISEFDPKRHADLWSGVGIAVTFAGGVETPVMEELWDVAGQYRPQLSLGSAMVARIRQQTNSVNEHSEAAAKVFCGTSVAKTDALLETSLEGLPDDGTSGTYLLWRDRVAEIVTASRA